MNKFLAFVFCGFLVSCAHQSNQDHLTMATLWAQKSGEARALSYQAFNLAKRELSYKLRKKGKKPLAIVVDVDETVLDNSPYQARGILNGTGYPDGWRDWINAAVAKPLPGAVEFLNYAPRRGVEVFDITNRKIIGLNPTIKNLKDTGFPVKEENVMCRTNTSSKKKRRSEVLKKYEIALLMGDNLGDFDEIFETDDLRRRNELVSKKKSMFGTKFIVLPKAMYGNWEGAVYTGNFKLSPKEKSKVRYKSLEAFKL